MNKKILLAGPWIGEFGWELCCWQGHLRRLSKDYDYTVVISRDGNEFLYQDFCDTYIPFDPQSWKTNCWMCEDHIPYDKFIDNLKKDLCVEYKCDMNDITYIDGGKYNIGYLHEISDDFKNQEFIKYHSNVSNKKYDLIIHIRNKSTGSFVNYPLDKWKSLLDEITKVYPNIKIACMGNELAGYITKSNNVKIDDLRGINLETLTSIFNNSKLLIGPSSGPMHFGSLCGIKHIVWTDQKRSQGRYENEWNPHKTEVIVLDTGWNPKVLFLSHKIIQEISKLNMKFYFNYFIYKLKKLIK